MEGKEQQTGWVQCPEGEFARLQTRLIRHRRRRRFLQTAGVAGAAAVVAATTLALVPAQQSIEPEISHISCRKVLECARQFADNSLNDQLRDRIELHLRRCTYCHNRYYQLGLIS